MLILIVMKFIVLTIDKNWLIVPHCLTYCYALCLRRIFLPGMIYNKKILTLNSAATLLYFSFNVNVILKFHWALLNYSNVVTELCIEKSILVLSVLPVLLDIKHCMIDNRKMCRGRPIFVISRVSDEPAQFKPSWRPYN